MLCFFKTEEWQMEKYLHTFIADNADPFWVCGVKQCEIPFPHAVGMVGSRGAGNYQWVHVFADAYAEQTDKAEVRDS